jgi:amidohydrolase
MTKLDDDLVERIERTVRHNKDDLISLRRHFHAHPELSHKEYETTATVAQKLDDLGFQVNVRPEDTGLYADLVPEDFDPTVDPTVAIRSDIDALPIEEQIDVPYKSKNDGVMHACGHDVHMASTIGAGQALESVGSELPGRIRLLYQHAEEKVPGGANQMVSFGAIDEVDAILGLHCDPELETGKIGLRKGAFTAGFDNFTIKVIGKGGHGARPHHCIDPVYVLTQVANALYQSIGRNFDSRDPATISIGSIRGGDAPNAIPETATIEGTFRTLSKDHQERVEPLLKRIVGGVCMAHDAKYEMDIEYGAPAIYNDPKIVDRLAEVAGGVLGEENIHEIPLPSMGSEDFSVYLQYAPGAMFRLGTAGVGPQHLLHSPKFNVDERAISIGAYVLANTAAGMLEDLAETSKPTTRETVEKARESVRERQEAPFGDASSTIEEAEAE